MKALVLLSLFAFALAFGCLQSEETPSPTPTPALPSFNLPTPTPVKATPSPSPTPRSTPLVTVIPSNVPIAESYDAVPCDNKTCENKNEVCKVDFNFIKQPDSCCKPNYCLWQGWCWSQFDFFWDNTDEYMYYCLNGSWVPVVAPSPTPKAKSNNS